MSGDSTCGPLVRINLDDLFRGVVRDELRSVVREEIAAALTQPRGAHPNEDGYLSVERAADLAEVHADTIRNWIKTGRLTEYRAGRELRVRRDDLHRFLRNPAGERNQPEEVAATILARGRK